VENLRGLVFCHTVQTVDKGLQPFTTSDNNRPDMRKQSHCVEKRQWLTSVHIRLPFQRYRIEEMNH